MREEDVLDDARLRWVRGAQLPGNSWRAGRRDLQVPVAAGVRRQKPTTPQNPTNCPRNREPRPRPQPLAAMGAENPECPAAPETQT